MSALNLEAVERDRIATERAASAGDPAAARGDRAAALRLATDHVPALVARARAAEAQRDAWVRAAWGVALDGPELLAPRLLALVADRDEQRDRADSAEAEVARLRAALTEALAGWADAEQHRPARRLHPEGDAAIARLRRILDGEPKGGA